MKNKYGKYSREVIQAARNEYKRMKYIEEEVDDDGNLKQHKNAEGYMEVKVMGDDGVIKTFNVHDMVWAAFKGEIPEGYKVTHINGDKTDNRLDNLTLTEIV